MTFAHGGGHRKTR